METRLCLAKPGEITREGQTLQTRYMLVWTACMPKSIPLPPNLTATYSRPDIVYVNRPNITFLELTISGNSKEAMRHAREQKQQKRPYLEITNDLHRQGLNVKYVTIEIGALGHSTKDTPYHLYHTITQVNRLQ